MNKQIEEMAKDLCHLPCTCDECTYPKYRKNIEKCRARVYAERAYNAGYRKQEWISVEERLPDPSEYDWVLVNVKDALDDANLVPSVAEYRNGEWFEKGEELSVTELLCYVTHWMPLPKPPKGDKTDAR